VDDLGELQDLVGDVQQQLLVLLFVLVDCLPVVVGQHLALLVGPVLADHHVGKVVQLFRQWFHRIWRWRQTGARLKHIADVAAIALIRADIDAARSWMWRTLGDSHIGLRDTSAARAVVTASLCV
jgi:hypothetical protein